MPLEWIVPVFFVWMFCAICRRRTRHKVEQHSPYRENYRCEECHIGRTYKVK